MSYTLCRCQPGHADKLADFAVPIATRTYSEWVDASEALAWALAEHGIASWNERLADAGTHVLVCERPDTSIAACAFVRIAGDTAYLGGLYVQDVACGLGTMLRDERLRISREAGVHTAVMVIRSTNGPARALAERAGFAVVDERPCAHLSTVPRLVYEKRLSAPLLVPA